MAAYNAKSAAAAASSNAHRQLANFFVRSRHHVSHLSNVRLEDVPALVPLPEQSTNDPRYYSQGSESWLRVRQGKLTAGKLAKVLGFLGPVAKARALNAMRENQRDDDSSQGREKSPTDGMLWGQLHERSAMLTYLTAYLLPRCPGARLLETGFWPHDVTTSSLPLLSLGASPDGLVEGAEPLVGPGGAIFEAKCPFPAGHNGAAGPRAHDHVPARMMPQLQGNLLATGRSVCHLMSWGPSYAIVHEVRADSGYQQEMVGACAAAIAAHALGKGLTSAEMLLADSIKLRSKELAMQSTMLTRVAREQCVVAAPSVEVLRATYAAHPELARTAHADADGDV